MNAREFLTLLLDGASAALDAKHYKTFCVMLETTIVDLAQHYGAQNNAALQAQATELRELLVIVSNEI